MVYAVRDSGKLAGSCRSISSLQTGGHDSSALAYLWANRVELRVQYKQTSNRLKYNADTHLQLLLPVESSVGTQNNQSHAQTASWFRK